VEHRKFLDDFSDRWMENWNRHDTDGLIALTSADLVWDDRTFWPTVITDQDELRRYIDKIFSIMPDVTFGERARFFHPDHCQANILWRMEGSGPPGIAADKRYAFEGCDIFLEFHDDKLAHYQAAYDITDMMRQLEMLPPREGRIGGAYFLSLLDPVRQ
jgi:predicted ester cyclase